MSRSRSPAVFALLAPIVVATLACDGKSTPELKVESASSSGPRIVSFDPPVGSFDVDPSRTTMTVVFDRPMDPEGWAWVIENPASAPEMGDSGWDPAHRINTVNVRLEPGHDYVVWVNSPQYLYFKDPRGVPLAPVRWTFSTSAAAGPAPVAPIASRAGPSSRAGSPRVVALDPPNGAGAVDSARTSIRATFDRPMDASWAWVIEDTESFPETTGEGSFDSDRRTAVLPVRLQPGRTYVVWLNSAEHQLFRDVAGTPAAPLRWVFTTRGAPASDPNRP